MKKDTVIKIALTVVFVAQILFATQAANATPVGWVAEDFAGVKSVREIATNRRYLTPLVGINHTFTEISTLIGPGDLYDGFVLATAAEVIHLASAYATFIPGGSVSGNIDLFTDLGFIPFGFGNFLSGRTDDAVFIGAHPLRTYREQHVRRTPRE